MEKDEESMKACTFLRKQSYSLDSYQRASYNYQVLPKYYIYFQKVPGFLDNISQEPKQQVTEEGLLLSRAPFQAISFKVSWTLWQAQQLLLQ